MIVTQDGYEWDEAKNAENVRKHGIDFPLASRIFRGFVLTEIDERFFYSELRESSIGMVGPAAVVVVIHTERSGRTRIISARPALRIERRRYEEALRKSIDP